MQQILYQKNISKIRRHTGESPVFNFSMSRCIVRVLDGDRPFYHLLNSVKMSSTQKVISELDLRLLPIKKKDALLFELSTFLREVDIKSMNEFLIHFAWHNAEEATVPNPSAFRFRTCVHDFLHEVEEIVTPLIE